jgi:hypothetical protein
VRSRRGSNALLGRNKTKWCGYSSAGLASCYAGARVAGLDQGLVPGTTSGAPWKGPAALLLPQLDKLSRPKRKPGQRDNEGVQTIVWHPSH